MNNELLIEAVKINNLELVKYLVEHGVKHNIAVYYAARNNNLKMKQWLEENME